MSFLKKYKTTIIYGCSLAVLLVVLSLMEYRLVIIDHSFEIYIGSIALLFTALGIWLATKLLKPKTKTRIIEKETIIEKQIFINGSKQFVLDEKALAATDISARELEVLQLMAKGLSNREIAETLFVSVNTVKTHVTNLFFKLDVTRRMQAIERARQLSIIA